MGVPETSLQNEKTALSKTKCSMPNKSSMKGTCNTYGQLLLSFNLRIIQEFSASNRQKNKNIQPGPEKQHSYIK